MSRTIDVKHLGREHAIAAHEIDGVLIDPGPESCIETLLEQLGGEPPHALLLTHIHLDHAGGTGALVRRFPELPVYVHERGAPHLIDPERLLESAGRLYGDEMERLWGEVVPVPAVNVHALEGGEEVEGFEVAYTPGHASHHVCYLHRSSGEAYIGDMAGVRIPPEEYTIMPTPPPDIDVEAWYEALDLIEAWRPRALYLTHFGRVEDVDDQIARARDALDGQLHWAREYGRDDFVSVFDDALRDASGEEGMETRVQVVSAEQTYLGLDRYLRQRAAEAAGSA